MTGVLTQISGPADVRALPENCLEALAAEIRAELVSVISHTGGHLGPNLGVVELTIALHRVFDSPRDVLLFDTGHQCYVHKMLTGRAGALGTIRHRDGLSGYPSRHESEHDIVENSHASTALSYADGLAKAFELQGETDRRVVAVVGDGALTGGMSWEALNNLGAAADRPVIILLNDNARSYSPTVGALSRHLTELRAGTAGPQLFNQLGFSYLGPFDGHDVGAVEKGLRAALDEGRPTVVHCITEKGRGYHAAESHEADRMHAISPAATPGAISGPSWTEVFADELVAIAETNADVVGISAAMVHPTGLHQLARRFPDRVHDVGIAEQHAVTSAAGLATAGLHPVVAVYATFLNRAFDQMLMDVALHRLPVTFVLDRAGITGTDGPSHNGMWDLSLLAMVPAMRVAAPRDAPRLRQLLREAVAESTAPTALRFPKAEVREELPALAPLGRGEVLFASADAEVLLVGVGPMNQVALDAAAKLGAAGIAVTVVDPRWILPIDPALVTAAGQHRLVVTIEDSGAAGGFGDAFCRALRTAGVMTPTQTLSIEQRFLPHADRSSLLCEQNLDPDGVVAAVLTHLPAPLVRVAVSESALR